MNQDYTKELGCCLDRLQLQSDITGKQQLQNRLQQLVFEAVCLKKGSFLSSITVSQPAESMSHQPEVTDAIPEATCSALVVSLALTPCPQESIAKWFIALRALVCVCFCLSVVC